MGFLFVDPFLMPETEQQNNSMKHKILFSARENSGQNSYQAPNSLQGHCHKQSTNLLYRNGHLKTNIIQGHCQAPKRIKTISKFMYRLWRTNTKLANLTSVSGSQQIWSKELRLWRQPWQNLSWGVGYWCGPQGRRVHACPAFFHDK